MGLHRQTEIKETRTESRLNTAKQICKEKFLQITFNEPEKKKQKTTIRYAASFFATAKVRNRVRRTR